ncbi:MAG: tRNA (adenosine(37)-N6)-threonylcarbamoyltransferase complex ATPase subunit type 1 TsaE [Candidatus Levybacteria bacterium]|nr:tRNA (adenosine(37)-N6)-threonylcarbamoyltransferase complex ATPase subunit type 1 TsaE [Candidatus Levybacteria bacterium]
MNKNTIRTQNISETKKIGKDIAKNLHGGEVIALHGELGSGKTAFVQGVAEAFQIQNASSPTFLIIHEYKVLNNLDIKRIYHIDLYRIDAQDNSIVYQLKEILEDKKAVVFIEWPEKIDQGILPHAKYIYFSFIDENTREITLEKI